MKTCYGCGSNSTYKLRYENWYYNRDEDDNVLCAKCYKRYLWSPYRSNRSHEQDRAMTLGGKRIWLDHNPRTGTCHKCGFIGRTHMHHEKYDYSAPLKYTVELCVSCHTKRSWELGQIQLLR